MLLSNIVNAVNAKSFGETNYTYEDIFPFFQSAISDLNSELDVIRRIKLPSNVSSSNVAYATSSYDVISDTNILNYVVTYIVVAMDDAMLSTTQRTEQYRTKLATYKKVLISELYKYMPITAVTNQTFSIGDAHKQGTSNIPNVTAWYEEDIYGKLSCRENGHTIGEIKIRFDNPYGTLEPYSQTDKNYTNTHIKEGTNVYTFLFTPSDPFKAYYRPVIIGVVLTGYDIERTDNIIPEDMDYTISIIQGDTVDYSFDLDQELSGAELYLTCAAYNINEQLTYLGQTNDAYRYKLNFSDVFTNGLQSGISTYDLTLVYAGSTKTILKDQPFQVIRKNNRVVL